METLNEYRALIRRIISDSATHRPSVGDVQIEVVFDESNDHYELVYSGWNGPHRIHGPVLHIDIRDGKIWIQYDGTEDSIAEELVAAGVPRDKIVLAYKSPELRFLTDYAVA